MKIYQNKTIFCFGFWALGCPKKTKKLKKWSYRWSEPFGTKRFKTFIFLVIFWFLLIRVTATFFFKITFRTKKQAIFFFKWPYRWFLENLKIIIYLDILFMIF